MNTDTENIQTYDRAIVTRGAKEEELEHAEDGTQGSTIKNDRGTSFVVVYHAGLKKWVSFYDYNRLNKE